MKPRERILNSILGKEVDRVAWCPFLAYYWDYLDEDIRQKVASGDILTTF